MGRASRKGGGSSELRGHWTDTHPDRSLWSPGRLAQARTQTLEEYEALYGRGGPVEPQSRLREVSSPLFPDMPAELGLLLASPEPLPAPQRIEVLSHLRLQRDDYKELSGDPVMEALWQKEIKLLEGDLQGLGDMVSDEDLRSAWDDFLLPHISLKQDPRYLAEGPTTLLQAAFEGGYITPASLADMLSDSPQAEQIIRGQILPAMHFFMNDSRSDTDLDNRVLFSLRQWIRETAPEYDQESDPWGQHHLILRYLEEGGFAKIEEFEQAPVHNGTSRAGPGDQTTISREFWLELCDSASSLDALEIDPLAEGTPGERIRQIVAAEAAGASRSLAARQVLRILAGVREGTYLVEDLEMDHLDSDRAWDLYANGPGECPLENLRPLFRGLQAENELDLLIGDVVEKGVRDDLGQYVRDEIYDRLPAPLGPKNVWARHIADTIRGVL